MKITTFFITSVASLSILLSACGNAVNPAANNSAVNNTNSAVVKNTAPASNSNSAANTNKSAAVSDIRSVDFLDYTYQSSACAEDVGVPATVKVSKGKFKDADNFYNVIDDKVIYGDVNGDGSEDAVIQILCGASNSATLRAFEIHAYSFKDGKATLLGRLDSTGVQKDYQKTKADGTVFVPGDKDVKIENGQLIVEVLADGSFASPENIATFNYKWNGTSFDLNRTPTKKSNK